MEKNRSTTAQYIMNTLAGKSDAELHKMINDIQMLMTYYRCAILETETKFRVLDEQFSLAHERNPISGIKSRLKSLSSIQEKLQRKGLTVSLDNIEENLNDVAGVRVICGFVDDIYMLADCLIQQDDVTLLCKKDYIAQPKPNGYRSLHLIIEIPIFLSGGKKNVKVEVQLRTISMDSWASLEHRMRYKKLLSEEKQQKTSKMLNECAELSNDLDSRMREIRRIIEEE